MASTPNFAWPTPDDTDPVGDGALDIRTLANAIDTQVFAGGLVLVKKQVVGTAVTTVDVTSCFNSTYDYYKIVYTAGTSSGLNSISSQFLSGVTPNATNYFGGLTFLNIGAAAWQVAANNGGGSWVVGWARGTDTGFSFEVHNVFQAKPTTCFGVFCRLDNGQIGNTFIQHGVSTSYNGIRFTTGGGTITGGTIYVYGFRK